MEFKFPKLEATYVFFAKVNSGPSVSTVFLKEKKKVPRALSYVLLPNFT